MVPPFEVAEEERARAPRSPAHQLDDDFPRSAPRAPLQRRDAGPLVDALPVSAMLGAPGPRGPSPGDQAFGEAPHQVAAAGVSGAGGALPHLDAIQRSFGAAHDVSAVQAHVGGSAAAACEGLQAHAYATGHSVAFREAPDLHTAAHEAAHVVQQRHGVQLPGGLGQSGDEHERHADAVADRVVRGESAAELLAQRSGAAPVSWGRGEVQRKAVSWGRPGAQVVQLDKDTEAEEQRKALETFKKGTYAVKDHVPSTGYGAFDVSYIPASSALNVTVRVDAEFLDYKGQKWSEHTGIWGAVERAINTTVWFEEYRKAMAARWSDQYSMSCVKKHWESLSAMPHVSIVRDSANPHFKLSVRKMAPGKQFGAAQVNTGAYTTKAPGSYGSYGGTTGVDLGSTDTTPNPDWRTGPVTTTEQARLDAANPKTVEFANNSDAVSGPDTDKLRYFGQVLSMVRNPKRTINITGRASTTGNAASNQDLSQRRAEHVSAQIKSAGSLTHTLNATAVGATGATADAKWRRVDIEVAPLDPAWKNDYDVAGHEFGHMIGLDEEYPGTAKSEHYQLVEEAFGKKIADQFLQREGSSHSIMSSGMDVRPYHYVTFWEALGRATSPTLTRSDWKINV